MLKKSDDRQRAVLLSILCSLGLILALALLGWFFLPRSAQMAGAGRGSGGGTGAGTGTSEGVGSGGMGGTGGDDAGGTSTGSGNGGNAQGDSKTSGTDATATTGNGASTGTATVVGKPEGQPGAEATTPAADTRPGPAANVEPAANVGPAATPPPLPSETPGPAPQVMALGNFKFTDKSASSGAGLAAGGPSSPAFFGTRGKGTKFVYIVDRSGSMDGSRFDAACDELKKSLKSLRPGMSFHVIFYDSTDEDLPGTPLQAATTENIDKAIKWIEGQSPRGGTEPEDAMVRALKLKPHTIWLLTDGQFSDRICENITPVNPERKVSINTIAIHDKSGEALLKRIAEQNKGDYRFIPAPTGSPSGKRIPGRVTRP
jgi:hypothetical protein